MTKKEKIIQEYNNIRKEKIALKVEDIAKKVDCDIQYAYMTLREMHWKPTWIEREEFIKKYHENYTINELAEKLELSYASVQRILSKHKISAKRKRKYDIEEVKKYYIENRDSKTITDMAKESGYSEGVLTRVSAEYGKKHGKAPRINEVMKYVLRNYPAEDRPTIAKKHNTSKQYILQCIRYLRKHKIWENKDKYLEN